MRSRDRLKIRHTRRARLARAPLGLVLLLAVAGCAHWHPSLVADREVGFAPFRDSVRAARFEDYAGRRGARVESQAAFDEMKRHILALYDGVTPVHTFLGRDNQFVDCVPIEQQPGLRNPRLGRIPLQRVPPAVSDARPVSAAPRSADSAPRARQLADITLKPGVRDAFDREMYCPADTIPMRRVTLEEMTRFRTLRDFLAKGGRMSVARGKANLRPSEPTPGDPTHYYAAAFQDVANFGGDSWLNLWSPTVNTHEMSLSQIWVSAGDGDATQTVEAGWQVMPDKWSSTNAALFIYHTTKNYQDGTGCYNLDCSGFVQVANNVYLGAGFDHYSARDGGQWGFNIQVKRHTDGNWWLFYRGPGAYIAFGYFPGSLYGDGGMSREADSIGWGGEDTGEPTACQMGSGAFPAEGWGRAAFHDVVFYIDTRTVSQWANLYKVEQPGDCYLTELHNFAHFGDKTYFYFGGPRCK